jgi:hypothetical protein
MRTMIGKLLALGVRIDEANVIRPGEGVVGRPHLARALVRRGYAEDVADAYWAGVFGKRFYRWHIEKTLRDEELGEYERDTFCGKHLYVRGPKKGATDYSGIIYRENELFFDFTSIKRRTDSGLPKEEQEAEGQGQARRTEGCQAGK